MFHVSPHLKAYLNVPLLFKVKQNAPFKKILFLSTALWNWNLFSHINLPSFTVYLFLEKRSAENGAYRCLWLVH